MRIDEQTSTPPTPATMSASASASVPTMRAFSSRGPADAHTIRDVPKAKIEREGDLLIEVYAVATNPVDVKAV